MTNVDYVDVDRGEIRIKVWAQSQLSWEPKSADRETVLRCVERAQDKAQRRLAGLALVKRLLDDGAVDQRTPAERWRDEARGRMEPPPIE